MKKLYLLLLLILLPVEGYAQKVSQLPAATTLTPSDLNVVVQGGTTKRATMGTSVVFTDTSLVFSGAIEDIASMGVYEYIMSPASAPTGDIFGTSRMRKCTINSDFNISANSHCIAGYDLYSFEGTQTITVDFGFGTESKFIMSNPNATQINYAFFKPSIGDVNGTLVNPMTLDCEMDITGISGTITNPYCIYSPDTDKPSLFKGGILTDVIIPVGDITLTDSYDDKTIYFLTGSTQTVTVPSTLTASFNTTVVQGDANQITVVGSGGLTVIGADSKTKTRTTSSVITINVINASAAYVGGDIGL